MAKAAIVSDDTRLTFDVPEAGALIGLNKNASYAAAKRGDFPVIFIGKRMKVPKIPFLKMVNEATRPRG